MSRHKVTITRDGVTDHDAVVGYDPPLQTYFAIAFSAEGGDDDQVGLWLGVEMREYPTLGDLCQALHVDGCTLSGLKVEQALSMVLESARPHEPSAVETLGLLEALSRLSGGAAPE